MLVKGKYDVGHLLNHSQPIMVPTVWDVSNVSNILSRIEDSSENDYETRTPYKGVLDPM